jgi:IclR family transcriptional regulator, acetate operon repressor
MSAAPQYPVASVDNALRLLSMFRTQSEIRLSDAASELGVANSTVHRMLAMLAYHDFVRQDPATKGYRAGPALFEVGLSVVKRMDVRVHARPFLEEVTAKTGETTHCAVLQDANVRYVDAVESPKALRVAGRTGTLLPAHCSSAGKAILARLSGEEFGRLYRRERLVQTTTRSIANRTALADALERVRRTGYAVNDGESEEGVIAVGVAVTDDLGRTVAGLSCAAPAMRMRRGRAVEVARLLKDAAAGITTSLDGRGPDTP